MASTRAFTRRWYWGASSAIAAALSASSRPLWFGPNTCPWVHCFPPLHRVHYKISSAASHLTQQLKLPPKCAFRPGPPSSPICPRYCKLKPKAQTYIACVNPVSGTPRSQSAKLTAPFTRWEVKRYTRNVNAFNRPIARYRDVLAVTLCARG